MSARTLVLASAFTLGAVLSGGCQLVGGGEDDPIIKDWESDNVIGGQRNALSISGDMSGEGRLYFFYDGEFYYADFDVDVDVDAEGDRYTLEMRCDGDCDALDFDMECRMKRDGEELDCDGEDIWSEYEFSWIAL